MIGATLTDRVRTEHPQLERASVGEPVTVITKVKGLVRFVADRIAVEEVTR
jgi:hypothetical protein